MAKRTLAACVLALLALPLLVSTAEGGPLQVDVRRVRISLGFAGQQIFLFGQAVPGTERVALVLEAPPSSPVRLMEKGRVGPFWLGVRQYRVEDVPGLYRVHLGCPNGNVLHPCQDNDPLDEVNRELGSVGRIVGPEDIASRAKIEVLGGDVDEAARRRLLDGFWELEQRRGLYEVKRNSIRLNEEGRYCCACELPAGAPEGKYRATAFFLGRGRVLAVAEEGLFVGRSGVIAWLSRLARHHAALYGGMTVLIALAAGWLAGAVFRKETRH